MTDSLDTAVLAIDGGGTRCRLACATTGQVFHVETGPANAYSDFDGAVASINKGLSHLADQMDVEVSQLATLPAYVGLAGVSSIDIAQRLRHALPFRPIRIEDDRPAALRGALGHGDGAIIHCGTGTFFAFQHAGRMRLAGGWGAILGDKASAKWIGWSALSAALRVEDGTLPPSALATSLILEMGGVENLLTFASTARPAEFGAVAPRVTLAATQGDTLAISIMREGAEHIRQSIEALGWSPDSALCLTGGVAPHYKDYLPDSFLPAIRLPMGEPIDGALSMAEEVRDHAG